MDSNSSVVCAAAKRIKLVISDVDGVLTDGTFTLSVKVSGERVEGYRFNTRDGIGIKKCLSNGIPLALISGRDSLTVRTRALDLGLSEEYILLGISDKVGCVEGLMKSLGVSWDEIAFIGDDIQDLSLLRSVVLSAAPCDAVPEVYNEVLYKASSKGGGGVLREVCQLILNAKGLWQKILDEERILS
jgi:YrbI family 3-deoxy-D-manno-octulosonate 8-phosphate phosphatase